MTRQRIIGLLAVVALIVAELLTHGFGLFAPNEPDLKLYGNVDIRQVELGFRVGGRISDMAFDEGARVPAGAVLARLDARPLSDALATTQAQIALADADLAKSRNGNRAQDIARATQAVAEQRALYDKARADFERRSALLTSGAVSQALVTASRADFEASRARLRSAEDALSLQRAGSRSEDVAAARARRSAAVAQANRARTDITDTALLAPESGIVLTRAREPGAIVQPGEAVYTLTIDRPMRLRAYVAQTSLSRISPGMAVLVTADGNPKTYHGAIGFISPTAEFTPKSVQTESLRADLVYRLRINISDPDDALRQGQPVLSPFPPLALQRAEMGDVVASASGIVKRFGPQTALGDVAIEVRSGLMTGLVGPDGAGKTTLIRILAGLIDPDAGEAQALGTIATKADRARIGYMPQRFGLYEDLSVIENLRLYADLRGLDRDEWEESFARLLEFTDLKRFQSRLAGKLSGGMKQKLGLACALVRQPDLLLLDEPGVGVDPVSRRELWQMVRELTGEGVGVLWSTAYLDEAEMCDTVFLLSEGTLLHSGPPGDLLARVQGRVFRATVPAAKRRTTLTRLLDRDDVADGTLQGEGVRLLMCGKTPPAGEAGSFAGAAPRFEDGFIDILGAKVGGTSALAEAYRAIPESDTPAIEARGLTKRFGDFVAAQDISFSVPRGQIFGLLGPNGAGKSTTFKMLCGLLTPSMGTGSVAGFDLRKARANARQSLGYMAQKFSLYGDLSVRQNLDFFSGIYGLTGNRRRAAIERVNAIFHLERYASVNAGTLPLGFKQRLALACAVMHEPPVLFLDEPTSGVDPIVRREFWCHINGLVERGVTVLVTTHFMDEAEYCDRIALIYQAGQIATGTPDELKSRTGSQTMEEAFIALIEAADQAREAA